MALVAEQVVNMQREVGIEGAKALQKADLRVFSGGKGSEQGFQLASLVESITVGNDDAAKSVLNHIARPNDLGLSQLRQVLSGSDNASTPAVPKEPTASPTA